MNFFPSKFSHFDEKKIDLEVDSHAMYHSRFSGLLFNFKIKWKSTEGEKEYLKAYGEALNLFPPSQSLQFKTSLGTVQVHCWKADSPFSKSPLVLLPGRSSGSPMWIKNILDFQQSRTIYAIDALGDAGLSIQTKTIKNSEDQALWIEETLEHLEIPKLHMIGHSFGGWLAANYSTIYPARIDSLILLEPVFTFRLIKLKIILKSIPYNLAFLPKKWRQGLLHEIAGTDSIDYSDPVAKMIDIAINYYKSKLPAPAKFNVEQIKNWNFHVYAAFADKSAVHNSEKAIKFARENVRSIEAKLWNNATHSLPMEYTKEIDAEIIDFMERVETNKNDT